MATKKVLVQISVEQTGKGATGAAKDVDKLTKATDRLNAELSEEAQNLAFINEQTSRAKKSNKDLAKAQVDAANSTKGLNDNLQEMKTTAGLSGAIVTEFGRTISDLPYGIRGVGNNLSQLGTLFGLFATNVTKSGRTMADGFRELFSQFKGIIGIMTAFQVALAFIQSEWFQKWSAGLLRTTGLLKIFSTELSNLKKGVSGVTDEFGGMITELEVYTEILESSTRSIEDKEKAYDKIIDKFPEMESSIKRVGDEFVVSAEAVDTMKESLEELAISSAALNRLKEISAERLKVTIDQKLANDELNTTLDNQIKNLKDMGVLSNRTAGQLRFYREQIEDVTTSEEDRLLAMVRSSEILEKGQELSKIGSSTAEEYESSINKLRLATEDYAKVNENSIKNSEKEIELLKEYIELEDKQKKESTSTKSPATNRQLRAFQEGSLLLSSEEERFRKQRLALDRRTLEKQIEDEREASEILIDIKLEEFQKRQKLRLENYLKTKGLTEEQKKDARESYTESIDLAEDEAARVIKAIQSVAQERQKQREDNQAIARRQRANALSEANARTGVIESTTESGRIAAQQLLNSLEYENQVQHIESLIALETSANDTRMKLENDLALLKKENANEEYKTALALEDAKLSLANAGANAVVSILGKQTQEGKIVAATMATINTYQAITKVLAETTDVTPTQSLRFANAAVVGLQGFAQVKNILSTNSPNTSGSAATSGGATTVQPPDFNIIGSNGVNQLADAIGSTEQKPVQAYVTATQVTTVQALQRNNRKNGEV